MFTSDRTITPRDYQDTTVQDTLAAFQRGEQGVMIRLPTGCGKTITAGLIAKDWLRRSPSHRVMVLCHETQLVDQFAQELWDVTGYRAAIEQGQRRIGIRDKPKLVVASRNSLAERVLINEYGCEERASRLGKFSHTDDCLVIVDEAHKYSRGLKLCGHFFEHFERNPNSQRHPRRGDRD